MSTIPHDCPHCGSIKAGFTVVGIKSFPIETAATTNTNIRGVVNSQQTLRFSCGAMCPVCYSPIGALLECTAINIAHMIQTMQPKLITDPSQVETLGFKLIEVWPKPPKPQIPEYLPEQITRAFAQAERNFHQVGNEEASAIMYRRALELAIGDKYPALKGTLAKRTKDLVGQKEIPAAMGDWANEIRDLGNEAAHDQTVVDKRELTMIRGFADALLKYL